jgi:hypothetical protein
MKSFIKETSPQQESDTLIMSELQALALANNVRSSVGLRIIEESLRAQVLIEPLGPLHD